MHLIYQPSINYGVRTVLKPFARLLPASLQFPVDGVIRVSVGLGKQIRLACNPTSYLAKVLFWQGFTGFEYNTVRIFVELVQEAKVFLDVGANIGYYSLLAAVYNPQIRILSFEPLPSAFHYLQKNLDLNQCAHATPLKWALSDMVGTTTFFAAKKAKFLEIEHHLT
ncbi:MAG TPA: FkbM family methyltransferase, partial [Rhodothermales bacterium]|nr:FkbM family methyltransferase [Rhodothermales bacterium]